ncbi:hypothetical protein V2A85_23005 [Yersinia sp. 1252 StPb PI]|uniref:hypothetical protein n=1 Tax=Yersinia sp. 1252 StPb PI TaxID=3117404 RepID=UPI003B289246
MNYKAILFSVFSLAVFQTAAAQTTIENEVNVSSPTPANYDCSWPNIVHLVTGRFIAIVNRHGFDRNAYIFRQNNGTNICVQSDPVAAGFNNDRSEAIRNAFLMNSQVTISTGSNGTVVSLRVDN